MLRVGDHLCVARGKARADDAGGCGDDAVRRVGVEVAGEPGAVDGDFGSERDEGEAGSREGLLHPLFARQMDAKRPFASSIANSQTEIADSSNKPSAAAASITFNVPEGSILATRLLPDPVVRIQQHGTAASVIRFPLSLDGIPLHVDWRNDIAEDFDGALHPSPGRLGFSSSIGTTRATGAAALGDDDLLAGFLDIVEKS